MSDQARLLEAIAGRRRVVKTNADFRPDVLAQIRRFVHFDAYVWLLCDPATSVGGAPLADVPCLPELRTLIRSKYLTDVNRWTSLAPPWVESLSLATAGNLNESAVWRHVQSRYRVTDVMSAVFTDRFGTWGFLDLWRMDAAPFTLAELQLLAAVTAPLTEWLRAHQAATFLQVSVAANSPIGAIPRGPAVLLVDDDLKIVGQTPASSDWLQRLLPPAPGGAAIPACVYNVAAQLLATEYGIDSNSPSTRVHLPDGGWLTLRAARLEGIPGIAVSIEHTSPADRLDLFCRAFGLTPREAEIVTELATGTDTRTLAQSTHLSEHTIQDHLKSIFAKTGIHTRRSLLSSALGLRPPPGTRPAPPG